MDIIISNSSNQPIFEQIKQAIKKAIATNELKENEILPSIRNLAQDLRISVMTVKRAYDELEQEGFIKTIHGKGSLVAAKNIELLKEEQMKEIEKYIDKIVLISKTSNISKKEILETFEYLFGEDE